MNICYTFIISIFIFFPMISGEIKIKTFSWSDLGCTEDMGRPSRPLSDTFPHPSSKFFWNATT